MNQRIAESRHDSTYRDSSSGSFVARLYYIVTKTLKVGPDCDPTFNTFSMYNNYT